MVGEATGLFSWPLEYTEGWRQKQLRNYKSKKIYNSLYYLKRQGLVKEASKNGRKFLILTQKGQLEVLLSKARDKNPAEQNWDGKWRLIIFDIPEEAHDKRDKLRRILKEMGFIKLQASVFISPFPIAGSAVDYLKQSGLIEFIRFGRLDELDDDRKLKEKFKLR